MQSALRWFMRHAFTLLRVSIGIIYLWFGALKYVPQLSPADQLAKDTIHVLTFGLIPSAWALFLLALWETLLGMLLIFGWWRNIVFYVLMVHMVCTFLPIFFFEQVSFTVMPYGFTLVGQYIMKNLVIVCALIVLQAHYKGKIVLNLESDKPVIG